MQCSMSPVVFSISEGPYVLETEFPDLPKITFHTADDHFKAVGQHGPGLVRFMAKVDTSEHLRQVASGQGQ